MRSRDYEEGYDAAINDVQTAMEVGGTTMFDGSHFTMLDDPNIWVPKLRELRVKRFIG